MAPSTFDTFRYKSLQSGEIRLLELVPHAKYLVGKLRHYQTEGDPDHSKYVSVPSYTALSHHWDPKPEGDQKLNVLMLLDPEDSTDQTLCELPLRPSLYDALQSIRTKMNEREWQSKGWTNLIWVDAICINQDSNEDKNKQLGRMGDIYNAAEAVIVWLGQPDDNTNRAMDFVKRLQVLNHLKEFLSKDQYEGDWMSLVMLTRKPCFQRLWIVQEIAAARHAIILAGTQYILWDEFASAWSIFVSQFEQIRTMLSGSGFYGRKRDPFGEVKLLGANILVENRGNLLRKRVDGGIAEHLRSLEYLLTSLSMFEVTEPHDIVYAILWLSSDASQGKRKQHAYVQKTPTTEDARKPKRLHLDPGFPASDFPPLPHGSTPSEGLSPIYDRSAAHLKRRISAQFLPLPAAVHEQMEADSQMLRDTGIRIDYAQPVFDLCVQVLKHIISTTQRLDIICFHWAPFPQEPDPRRGRRESEPEHPSWLLYNQRNAYEQTESTECAAPAVQRIHADPLIGQPGSNKRPYLACGKTRATEVRIEGRVLRAYGYVLDTIEVDAGVALNAVIPWRWRQELSWTNNSQLPPDSFWRTLVADKGSDDQTPPPRFALACRWAFELGGRVPTSNRASTRKFIHGPNVSLQGVRNMGDGEAPLKEFLDCAIATTWNRKLFKTKARPKAKGASHEEVFVGLGPQELEIGDVVCILWGCAVPVILRPLRTRLVNGKDNSTAHNEAPPEIHVIQDADENLVESTPSPQREGSTGQKRARALTIRTEQPFSEDYTFVGECYVHGMMNGEIFNWADSNGSMFQDFKLH